MKIAFVLFDRVTYLDFFGFYDVITRVKTLGFDEDMKWNICALKDEISDDKNLIIKPDTVSQSLDGYDMVFIPGGLGTRVLQYDDIFLSWIKSSKTAKYKVSVCTGSLLFGAAGFLKEKRATTHPNAYDLLKPYCKEVVPKKVVEDGDFISGGGVSSSIELALHVSEKIYGLHVKEEIAKSIDY